MILHEFDYHRPATRTEALALVGSQPGRCCLYGGGTDVLVRLKQGQLKPCLVVDLKGLGLDRLVFDPAQGLSIGAVTTLRDIEVSTEVARWYPALHEAVSHMASTQVRSRATIGGNLCNAAPSADTAPPLIVYGASVVIEGAVESRVGETDQPGSSVTREIPVEKLFLGPGATVLLPVEIMTEVRVPGPLARTGSAYLKLRRTEKDIALVGVAALFRLDNQGACAEVRIALGAVAPTPVRARGAEKILRDRQATDELVSLAAEAAMLDASPIDDMRASARYRRDMIRELTRETLKIALTRAKS
ncbi:MAG: FAD binding domain-containing protein [Desulfocucumaceae bacterium]